MHSQSIQNKKNLLISVGCLNYFVQQSIQNKRTLLIYQLSKLPLLKNQSRIKGSWTVLYGAIFTRTEMRCDPTANNLCTSSDKYAIGLLFWRDIWIINCYNDFLGPFSGPNFDKMCKVLSAQSVQDKLKSIITLGDKSPPWWKAIKRIQKFLLWLN